MALCVIPAVYDAVKKQIRPIGIDERLSPSYFGLRMSAILSADPGQALQLDSKNLLYCTVVSKDSRNLIVYGSDKGAYIDTSQILSNAATNLLTTSPTDLRVVLTKQTLLDAGLADATTVYQAMQQHLIAIHQAKEDAARSAAAATAGATTVSRLITEAENVVREKAADIAAESIVGQVVDRAASAAVSMIDTKQDRDIAALTTRIINAENKHAIDVTSLTNRITSVNDDVTSLSANWAQNFATVTRTNVEQDQLIAEVISRADTFNERLLYLKCGYDKLDAKIYANFVCLVNRIVCAEDTLNTRITREVDTLNTRITREVDTLNTRITREVDTLNTRITREVDTLNTRITREVDTLDTRITTEVTRLDGLIEKINATQAAAWTSIARTLSEQAERLLNDETQHKEDVATLNTRITDEVDTLNTRITREVDTLNTRITDEVDTLNTRITTEVTRLDGLIITTNAVVTEGFTKVARTQTEIAERLFNDETQHKEDVATLNTRITTEVNRIDDSIEQTNAAFTEAVTKLTHTDTAQAVCLVDLRVDHDSTDRRLSENIVHQTAQFVAQEASIAEVRALCDSTDRRLSENIVTQNKRYVEQSILQSELFQHQLNDAVRFSDLSYASVIHTRELQSLDSFAVTLCANIIKNTRTLIEQAVFLLSILRGAITYSGDPLYNIDGGELSG